MWCTKQAPGDLPLLSITELQHRAAASSVGQNVALEPGVLTETFAA